MCLRKIFTLAGAVAKRTPQSYLVPPVSEIEQLLLVPADQRRNQQIGKVQVVERLNGKRRGSKQVAHCERLR